MKFWAAMLCFGAILLDCAAPPKAAGRLDRYLTSLQDSGFSGVVIVAGKQGILLSKGYGLADRSNEIPASPNTLFQIGSLTKQFTAAAILKLELEGRLTVQDPITRFLRDVPADKRGITIHQLLTHTAGLPDVVGGCSSRESGDRDAQVKRVLGAKLESPAGTGYRYSSAGYGLLGAIIEIASGQRYEAYLRQHLFRPAGMDGTGYSFKASDSNRIARGYRDNQEYRGIINAWVGDGPVWCVRASGGLLSTAEDMYRWHQALRGTRVLSEPAKRKYFARQVPEQPEETSFYGYGWSISKTRRGTPVIGHDGSIGDYFTADYRWYVDEGAFYFVAANTAEHTAMGVSPRIGALLFDETE